MAVPRAVGLHMVMAYCHLWSCPAVWHCADWVVALEARLLTPPFAQEKLFANDGGELVEALFFAALVTFKM